MRTLAILLLLTCALAIQAQAQQIRTVVLINGVPYMADVSSNGDILQRYQKIDDYFTAPESHTSIVSRLSKTSEVTGPSIVLFEKQEEPTPSYTEENKAPILEGTSQYLGFSPQKAILTKTAVDQIRKIAEEYQAGLIGKIEILSYHHDNYRSRAIARNRARGIKELLVAFGTPYPNVDFDIRDASAGTKLDFVRVTFL